MDLNKLVMVILVRLGIFVYTERLMKILVVCHFLKYSRLKSVGTKSLVLIPKFENNSMPARSVLMSVGFMYRNDIIEDVICTW